MSTKYILPDAAAPVAAIIAKALTPYVLVQTIKDDPELLADKAQLTSKIRITVKPISECIVASLSGNAEGAEDILSKGITEEFTRHLKQFGGAEGEILAALFEPLANMLGGKPKGPKTASEVVEEFRKDQQRREAGATKPDPDQRRMSDDMQDRKITLADLLGVDPSLFR